MRIAGGYSGSSEELHEFWLEYLAKAPEIFNAPALEFLDVAQRFRSCSIRENASEVLFPLFAAAALSLGGCLSKRSSAQCYLT